MNSLKSFYLESLRVFAAFYVFIFHIGSESINNKQYLSNEKFVKTLNLNYTTANCCVMIFFVLSGFLITTSASKPNLTFKSFIVNRLGRLYSVLLPALVVSFLFSFFFRFFNFSIGQSLENLSLPIPRFLLNFFFLGQAYTLCSVPPLNRPFWSVQYEFIYYLIIGIAFLIKKWYKYFLLLIVVVISWIKILLLFPVWFMGSILYYINLKYKLNKFISVLFFIVSTYLIVCCLFNSSFLPFQKSTSDNRLFGYTLFLSWNYKANYIFGFLVFLNMYSVFQICDTSINKVGTNKIFIYLFEKLKIVGNCTYTLYLFHTPLLFFYSTILPYNRFNTLHIFGLFLLVLTTVYFIARLTEWRVLFWRQKVSYFFEFFSNKSLSH